MTTTPTIWRPAFTVNADFTAGLQTVPQTISLKNGNILVVWEDDTNGPDPGVDIMGRMFDPEGVAIGAPFQVNKVIYATDETGPKIVELPDGGFVMAYGSYDNQGGFVAVERYNSSGQFAWNNLIRNPSLTDWELTADSAGNYTIVYERQFEPGDIDIHSLTYNFSNNAPGPERNNLAQNSSEHDRLGATAAFADGRIVTFYTEPDDYWLAGTFLPPLFVDSTTYEFTITNPLTGATVRAATEIADPEIREDGRAQDVAILTGGQIVLLYGINRNGGELAMRIVADGSASGGISPEMVIDDNFSLAGDNNRGFENAKVVGLQDGGFLVAWTSDLLLFASRYDASGALIGSKQVVDQQVAIDQTALFDLSLTGDGRVLIPFIRITGEIIEVILDPRDNVIFGTDAGEVITTQIGDTFIFGYGGSDTLLGQGGNDRLDGGTERDTLDGGGGGDTYVLADLGLIFFFFDPINGIQVVLGYDDVIEAAGGGTDTVLVRRVSSADSTQNGGYQLTANVENGVIEGAGIFDLSGNELANSLAGNSAANTLDGLGGNDQIRGGAGDDALMGGEGADALDGGPGGDRIDGGAGFDSASWLPVAFGARINLNDQTQNAFAAAGDVIAGVEVFYLTNSGDNFTGAAAGLYVYGFGGADRLTGGTGSDFIDGGTGGDTIDAGGGFDYISWNSSAAGLTVNLRTPAAGTGAAAGDAVSNAEAFYLSEFGDTFIGQNGANITFGQAGNDVLFGGLTSSDWLFGGAGNDFLSAGVFDDLLSGGAGFDTYAFTSSSSNGLDQILDFISADDVFMLQGSGYGLAPGKTFAAGVDFIASAAPLPVVAAGTLLYNTANGFLSFDSDGTGGSASIALAQIAGAPVVQANDFVVV